MTSCKHCNGTGRIQKMSGEADCHYCDWQGLPVDDADEDDWMIAEVGSPLMRIDEFVGNEWPGEWQGKWSDKKDD